MRLFWLLWGETCPKTLASDTALEQSVRALHTRARECVTLLTQPLKRNKRRDARRAQRPQPIWPPQKNQGRCTRAILSARARAKHTQRCKRASVVRERRARALETGVTTVNRAARKRRAHQRARESKASAPCAEGKKQPPLREKLLKVSETPKQWRTRSCARACRRRRRRRHRSARRRARTPTTSAASTSREFCFFSVVGHEC